MHHLSNTKSHRLTNIPTRFDARRRLLQGVPSYLLHFAARLMVVNVRPCVVELYINCSTLIIL